MWPSADSPRGEADGQSFVFPICAEDATSHSSIYCDVNHQNDSGIESNQVVKRCDSNNMFWLFSPAEKCFQTEEEICGKICKQLELDNCNFGARKLKDYWKFNKFKMSLVTCGSCLQNNFVSIYLEVLVIVRQLSDLME